MVDVSVMYIRGGGCLVMNTRVSQKNTFVVYNFGGRITGAYGSPEPPKKISEL